MKFEMLEFVLRLAGVEHTLDFNPITSYSHYGAPEPLRHFHRNIHGSGYSMHPELTRPSRTAGLANIYYSAPALGGAAALSLVGASILYTSVVIPETSTATRQSGVTGQPTIGTAGTDIIYGEDPESILDLFSWSYWRGY